MTREFTTYLKGIAIFLMVMGHSFGYPKYYIASVSYPSLFPYASYIHEFAFFAVVPMYMFLTGWTYYFHKDKTIKYSFEKIIVFLLNYWLVLFGFVALAYYTCNYKVTTSEMLTEMFAVSNSMDYSIMVFAWYIFLYLEAMFFLPFFHKIVDKYSAKKALLFVLLILIVAKILGSTLKSYGLRESFLYVAVVIEFFRSVPVAISGYLCAKYDVLRSLSIYLAKCPIPRPVILIGTILFYYLVSHVATISTGVFLCPIFIALLANSNINYHTFFNKLVLMLGKHSMNIWFLHCLFFAEATREVYQKYAFWPENPVLVLIWILVVCTLVSIPLTKVQNIIGKCVKQKINN